MILIDYSQAENMLRGKIRKEDSDTDYGLFEHSEAVADYLFKISTEMKETKPDLAVDPDKMRLAGLLHDIGKVKSDYELHSRAGALILEEKGLKEIADLVRKHGVAKEKAEIKGIEGRFEPETLEEELLTYADMRVKGDKVVSFEERYRDVLKRKDDNSVEYEALVRGEERLRKIVSKFDRFLSSD